MKFDEDSHASPIALRRRALGLTQAQLAEKAGCHIRQIQKLESGETLVSKMTLANAARLAFALDMSLDSLAAMC